MRELPLQVFIEFLSEMA
uniref:Uncharacterized protein n=1 Tax=Rhizophora mucronata TaxID=61149 RepID=A0A2P2NAW8_RHIMU